MTLSRFTENGVGELDRLHPIFPIFLSFLFFHFPIFSPFSHLIYQIYLLHLIYFPISDLIGRIASERWAKYIFIFLLFTIHASVVTSSAFGSHTQ